MKHLFHSPKLHVGGNCDVGSGERGALTGEEHEIVHRSAALLDAIFRLVFPSTVRPLLCDLPERVSRGEEAVEINLSNRSAHGDEVLVAEAKRAEQQIANVFSAEQRFVDRVVHMRVLLELHIDVMANVCGSKSSEGPVLLVPPLRQQHELSDAEHHTAAIVEVGNRRRRIRLPRVSAIRSTFTSRKQDECDQLDCRGSLVCQTFAIPVKHNRSLSEPHQLDDIESIGLLNGLDYRGDVFANDLRAPPGVVEQRLPWA